MTERSLPPILVLAQQYPVRMASVIARMIEKLKVMQDSLDNVAYDLVKHTKQKIVFAVLTNEPHTLEAITTNGIISPNDACIKFNKLTPNPFMSVNGSFKRTALFQKIQSSLESDVVDLLICYSTNAVVNWAFQHEVQQVIHLEEDAEFEDIEPLRASMEFTVL